MSVGHGSGVIEKSWIDDAIKFILEDCRLDHTHKIPLGGGSSTDGSIIFQDVRIPRTYKQKNGKQVDVFKYLALHEFVEKRLIDAGMPYTPAHACATAAELAAVQDDGMSITEYDDFWDHWLPIVGKTKLGDGTPDDLDMHAYEDQ